VVKTLVNISYCCDHAKGADPERAWHLPAQEHAEWLEKACDLYLDDGFDAIVSCTGFHGMINVNNSRTSYERDVMWRIARKVRTIVGCPQNPGHQVGAALCIRQGLEAASKFGYDVMIHTAEDVVPRKHVLGDMTEMCGIVGYRYYGSIWGPKRDQLNAQFFACRVNDLVGPWDAAAVTGYGCIEAYLASLLDFDDCLDVENYYRTTHDHSEWTRWAEEYKRG